MDQTADDPIRRILAYHRRTKHHLHRYAASAGHLDWANQPDPFRTYAGAPIVELPLLADALTATFADLHVPGAVLPRSLDVNSLAILYELSLGLSAWKEYRGARWALRCNPSSGNLHPTESYAIVPSLPGLQAGVYHYVSRDHCLEQRCKAKVMLPEETCLIGLSSILWREAWKYGERAFRYCQHDVGHAVAAVRYAAGCLGWSVRLLDTPGDVDVAGLLGLDRDDDFAQIARLDREHPDCLLLVGPPPLPKEIDLPVDAVRSGVWHGEPNRLSPDQVRWEVIDIAAEATTKPQTPSARDGVPDEWPTLPKRPTIAASRLIRQRRSCLALDGQTTIAASTFFAMLDSTLPRSGTAPWDVLPWSAHLDLALFVHRVEGLPAGLYFLERDIRRHEALRAALRPTFEWQRVVTAPDYLPLYRLSAGDLRDTARTVSCHQEIAADGAFSLGMIAHFGDSIRAKGAWWYRRLFWESGVLGQVLYLEAEAAGVRGTGIGCYFDDAVHELLGLAGDQFQSLYHFTIGGPVEDRRLRTMAPYAHLGRMN